LSEKNKNNIIIIINDLIILKIFARVSNLRLVKITFLGFIFIFFYHFFIVTVKLVGIQMDSCMTVRVGPTAIQLHFDLCSIFGQCTDNVVIVGQKTEKIKPNNAAHNMKQWGNRHLRTQTPIQHTTPSFRSGYL